MAVAFSEAQTAAWMAVTTALVWMSIAITLYEQAFLTRFDWQIITGKRRRRAIHLAYFGAKVGWWLYMALILARNYTTRRLDCQANMIAIQAAMAIVNTLSSVLLACRAVCVYRGKERTYITYGLLIATLGLAAAWFAGTEDVVAGWVDEPNFAFSTGHCTFSQVKTQYFVKYLVTILYDLAVLALTVVGVLRMTRAGTSHIGTVLIEQGFLYFLAVFVVNLPILVFTAAQTGPLLSLFFAVPSAAISLTLSTRLYVQLVEEAARKPAEISDDHLTSSASVSEKVLNFFTRRRSSARRDSTASSSGKTATGQTKSSNSANNALRKGSDAGLSYVGGYDSSLNNIDVEKQNGGMAQAVPAVLPSHRRSTSQPFGSLTGAVGDGRFEASHKATRYQGRGNHRHTTSADSLQGVQVTQTTIEETIPEDLDHRALLTSRRT